MEENQSDIAFEKKVMRPLKWAWILLLVLFSLILTTFFVLKIPYVQNAIANKVVNVLSKNLDTKVSIGEIGINIFKGIQATDLYIEDRNQDTLLYLAELNSDLLNTITSLYRKDIHIHKISAQGGTIQLRRSPNEELNNLMQLFQKEEDDSVSDEPTNKEKSSFFDKYSINLDIINFKDIQFSSVDSLWGVEHVGRFTELYALIDTFDLSTYHIVLGEIDLLNPSFAITEWEYLTSPVDSLEVYVEDKVKEIEEESKVFDPNIKINKLKIRNGSFALNDTEYEPYDYRLPSFDPSHINFNKIDVSVSDITYIFPYYAEGKNVELSVESGDFKVKETTADEIYVLPNKAGLKNVSITTNESYITDQIAFKYREIQDWQDFVDNVIIDGKLRDSEIALQDLLYWVPELQKNAFFKENYLRKININADIMGRVNSMNARDIFIRLGNEFALEGNFIARNLTDPENTSINATIKDLRTDVKSLSKLIPGFNPPENFYKLNEIDFSGRFDGFYQDFVAFGELQSDLGRADLDMRLNLKNGSRNANYSGQLNLYDFQVDQWSENPDFGIVTVTAAIENGKGLELHTAYAELTGELIAFDYKDYRYKGTINGILEKNHFDGKFSSDDENTQLDFTGNIDFGDEIPKYDFFADIQHVNLQKINLHDSITSVKGELTINLEGKDINTLVGSAQVANLYLQTERDELSLDTIYIESTLVNEIREINLSSSIAKANIEGNFILTELPDAMIDILKTNYPVLFKNVSYISGPPTEPSDVSFTATIDSAQNVYDFFIPKKLRTKSLQLNGNLISNQNVFQLDVTTPYFQYSNIILENIEGSYRQDNEKDILTVYLDQGQVSGIDLTDVEIGAESYSDTIYFELNTPEILDSMTNLNIAGQLHLDDNEVNVAFDKFIFQLLQSSWDVSPNNNIQLKDKYIKLDNVALKGDDRFLAFDDINDNKGISANIQKFNILLFNQWINDEMIRLGGSLTTDVSIDNIFTMEGVDFDGNVVDFTFNDVFLGQLFAEVNTSFSKSKIIYNAILEDGDVETTIDGYINTKSKTTNTSVSTNGFPLAILESILEGEISRTQGEISADLSVKGKLDDLNPMGTGKITNGATRINYLGTFYKMENANFEVSKNAIDFTGATLRDIRGNTAQVTGGLTHKNFMNLGVNCRIESDKFILLNTDENMNPAYYGFGQGAAVVDITGPFTDILISIDATTGADTKMTLPTSSYSVAREQSFIPIMTREEFVADINEKNKDNETEYVGLTMNMVLEITPQAQMTIMFDPSTGHLLRGSGSGDIEINVSPDGEIKMTGDFTTQEGIYDFAMITLLKKRFFIQPDGTVSWNGDPLDATIDIAANYRPIRASLKLFLAEYSTGDLSTDEETEVLMTVYLQDRLMNPKITFDLDFPNLQGNLKTLVESKMALLETDPVAMNNQVFSLLIFNNFANPSQGANAYTSAGIGVVVNEFVSSQMSAFTSTLVESLLNENSFIYDVDIDFNMENILGNESSEINETGFNNSREIGVRFTPKFNLDKVNLSIGTDYFDGSTTASNESFFGGDFTFDYYLTKDKNLRLRTYGRLDRDEVYENRRVRTGIGLYYKKDFKTLFGIEKKLRTLVKDVGVEQEGS